MSMCVFKDRLYLHNEVNQNAKKYLSKPETYVLNILSLKVEQQNYLEELSGSVYIPEKLYY